MSNTRKAPQFNLHSYNEILIIENQDIHNADTATKNIVFLHALLNNKLKVDNKSFNDFVTSDCFTLDEQLLLLEGGNLSTLQLSKKINDAFAIYAIEKYFAAYASDINSEQLEAIIKHWNKNLTEELILAMQQSIPSLNPSLRIKSTCNTNLVIKNNQIIIKNEHTNFELSNIESKNPSQYIATLAKDELNGVLIHIKNASTVTSRLSLTKNGFKIDKIEFSDLSIPNFYSDFLPILKAKQAQWQKEFREEFFELLSNKDSMYQSIRKTYLDKSDLEIEFFLNNPHELKKHDEHLFNRIIANIQNGFVYSPFDKVPFAQALLYQSMYECVHLNLLLKQQKFYDEYSRKFFQNKDNLKINWVQFNKTLPSVIKIIDESENNFNTAMRTLFALTKNKNISKPLRAAGKDVYNAVKKFQAKAKNSVNLIDLNHLNDFVTDTHNIIVDTSNVNNSILNSTTESTISDPKMSIATYSESISKVMGMDRNKWEVIAKAMIGVVGAILLAASITALVMCTSGAALPVIIAGLALGIKIGATVTGATVGSIALVTGTFFAKRADKGDMQLARNKVQAAANQEFNRHHRLEP